MTRAIGGPDLRVPAAGLLLGGPCWVAWSAALLLVAPAAGAAKAAELDGELLAAIAEWEPWEREQHAVEALDGDDPTYELRFDAYAGPWHDGMRDIMDLPARTPAGIQGKTRVLRTLLQNHVGYGSGLHEGSSPSEHGFAHRHHEPATAVAYAGCGGVGQGQCGRSGDVTRRGVAGGVRGV